MKKIALFFGAILLILATIIVSKTISNAPGAHQKSTALEILPAEAIAQHYEKITKMDGTISRETYLIDDKIYQDFITIINQIKIEFMPLEDCLYPLIFIIPLCSLLWQSLHSDARLCVAFL